MKKTFNQFPDDLDQAIHLRAYCEQKTQQEVVIAVLMREFAREWQMLQDAMVQAAQVPRPDFNDTNPESLDRTGLSDER